MSLKWHSASLHGAWRWKKLSLSLQVCRSELWHWHRLPDGNGVNSLFIGWHRSSYGPSTLTTNVVSEMTGRSLPVVCSTVLSDSWRVLWLWAERCQTSDATSQTLKDYGAQLGMRQTCSSVFKISSEQFDYACMRNPIGTPKKLKLPTLHVVSPAASCRPLSSLWSCWC